jgi:hypothetical protein
MKRFKVIFVDEQNFIDTTEIDAPNQETVYELFNVMFPDCNIDNVMPLII